MSISVHFNDIFPIVCLACGVVALVRPKWATPAIAVALASYGFLEIVNIRF
ncbi:MAG: hypothetical protein ACQES2_10925 [Pseudomonadota bacterium]